MASVDTQPISSGFARNSVYADTSNASSSSSTSGTSSSTFDMNSFLTMFTTQLKYQDPTNPLESYELAAQLAQFSTVEQLTQINSQLEEQEVILTAINNAQMVDILGNDVVGSDDTIQLKDGQISRGHYELADSATVTVKIYNDQDQLVRTMSVGAQEAGRYDVQWDGRSDAGEEMGDGNYYFDIEAVDAEGISVDVTETISGRASALRMEDGVAYLLLNSADGVKLPISAVIEVDDVLNG